MAGGPGTVAGSAASAQLCSTGRASEPAAWCTALESLPLPPLERGCALPPPRLGRRTPVPVITVAAANAAPATSRHLVIRIDRRLSPGPVTEITAVVESHGRCRRHLSVRPSVLKGILTVRSTSTSDTAWRRVRHFRPQDPRAQTVRSHRKPSRSSQPITAGIGAVEPSIGRAFSSSSSTLVELEGWPVVPAPPPPIAGCPAAAAAELRWASLTTRTFRVAHSVPPGR